MRHAKSDWTTGVSDFNRPINEQGINDLQTIANHFITLDIKPDLLISSPAKRTQITSTLLADSINYPASKIRYESSIYEGSPSDLVKIIECIENENATVLIVGHNPTFTFLIDYYSGSSIGNLPTSAMAVISFNIDEWKAVSFNSGTLENYIYPKKFR